MEPTDPPVRWNLPNPDPGQPAQGYPVLAGVEHVELFHAVPDIGTYCHHPHLAHYDDAFFATWSNDSVDEDGPGQRVLCSWSRDGITFDGVRAIRAGAPERRYEGKHKDRGFEYPSVVVTDAALWVIYSINKEDVAVSRVPGSALH